jgi:photosystem II PsbY protein
MWFMFWRIRPPQAFLDGSQVAELGADNRLGIIALLFVPVVGWVGFNILQPALNQLDAMSGAGAKAPKKATLRRSVAAGLGLAAASLFAVQSADAASEVRAWAA